MEHIDDMVVNQSLRKKDDNKIQVNYVALVIIDPLRIHVFIVIEVEENLYVIHNNIEVENIKVNNLVYKDQIIIRNGVEINYFIYGCIVVNVAEVHLFIINHEEISLVLFRL